MKGWLDKYQDGGVAKTDATRTSPALNYRSVEDSARIEREKELARRKTSVGPQSKPSVAMKQAAEERYAQQKRNEKYKKAAEYAQVIGGGLEVAAPFTGPLAPIIGGAGTITSAGSSAYLSGRDVADENYGSALMNAGFGGLGIAGYTPAARAANVGGVNVAKAANTADYVSDVASTYNAYDDYGSNYAQRIQNIRQHITDDEVKYIVRSRRGLTPYNNKLRSHPDDGFFDPQEYLPDPDDSFDVNTASSDEYHTRMDEIINRAMENALAREPSDISPYRVMGMSPSSNITRSPAGGLFGMTAEQTAAARANVNNSINTFNLNDLTTSTSLRGRLDQRIQSALGMNTSRNYITGFRPRQSLLQSLGESIYTGLGGSRRSHNQYVPFSQLVAEQNAGRGMTNISGFGNEQLLASDALINKDVVAKMAPEEFASTVYKPSGEVAPYQNMYDPLPGVYGMSPSQYANRFNQNLDLLNDIISKQNKTGVDYRVTGLDENGMLTFHTPKQIKRWQDDPFKVTSIENLEKLKNDPVELQKRLHGEMLTLEDFDGILNSLKEDRIIAPEGNRTWATRIIPGEFRGEIQDIPNAEYYKSIPGLNMASSSQGVFSDNVTRRGSGAYEAINEYLKRLDLGRVKPGFNSQSDSSRPLWENAIKKGKAFGYYSNPHTVYGAMKTVAPVIGAGAVASEFIDQKKNGGWLDKYNDGGPVQPNYNNYSVSAPEGFEGDGYSNVGRNYSPAWGGQFQKGGVVNRFMQPTETFKNYGYNPKENGMSTEYSTSIGGPGEVYLVPGYRQGRVLNDPEATFNMYGEHLGGPFKTVQSAEDFAKLRHQYVEKNQNIPAPIKTRDYAMGGSLPGATGSMYARVGAPSEDKGRNKRYKTDASAENGKEMKFYQEGLDFKPKSISKNGSKVIKDDRGQWDHPGEITEIGSNQITMQGVPYPVMGVSDTGDTQMMYPNQEYQYDGNSVTEYPMMQDGGVLDSIVNLGKRAVNYIGGLFDDDNNVNVNVNKDDLIGYAPTLKTSKAKNEYNKFNDIYYHSPQRKKVDRVSMPAMYNDVNIPDYSKDENRIKLGTGRFSGANVSSKLIDDIAAAAKRNNIPIGQLLTLAGRESTFGQQKGNNINSGNPRAYTSGWNVDEKYQPYEPKRFLADKKVPGINVIKSPNGYQYEVTDEKAIVEHLKKNPQLINEYKKKIESTPDIGNRNSFDLSAEFLKEKGIQGYNPRDPKYVEMFQKDYDTLKQDKALMSYLKKKGYKYEQGGQLTKLDQLTNFTNYNTKQPGGWLDKYQ